MADASQREAWNQLSHVLAAIINSNPFSEATVDPRDLNPYLRQEVVEREPTPISGHDLALLWCGRRAIDYFAALDRKD